MSRQRMQRSVDWHKARVRNLRIAVATMKTELAALRDEQRGIHRTAHLSGLESARIDFSIEDEADITRLKATAAQTIDRLLFENLTLRSSLILRGVRPEAIAIVRDIS